MYSYMRYVCVDCGQLIARYGRDAALSDNPPMLHLLFGRRHNREVDSIAVLTDLALAHEQETGHHDFKRELAMSTRSIEMELEERNPA